MRPSKVKRVIAALCAVAPAVQDDEAGYAAITEAAARLRELESLLRTAAGPESYGRWSSEFRERVDMALK